MNTFFNYCEVPYVRHKGTLRLSEREKADIRSTLDYLNNTVVQFDYRKYVETFSDEPTPFRVKTQSPLLTQYCNPDKKTITLWFSPVFHDQLDRYFVLKPSTVYQDIRRHLKGASPKDALYLLIDWLFLTFEFLRRTGKTHNEEITETISLFELAHILKYKSILDIGSWRAILQNIGYCLTVAKQLGYLSDFSFEKFENDKVRNYTICLKYNRSKFLFPSEYYAGADTPLSSAQSNFLKIIS